MGGPAGHQFPVVHVWGTAYEMGVAQGLLLKASITAFVNQTLTYIITQARRPVREANPVATRVFVLLSAVEFSSLGPFRVEHSQHLINTCLRLLTLTTQAFGCRAIPHDHPIMYQAVDSWPSDFFSPAIKALIVEFGIDVALDWNAGVTAPFTPQVWGQYTHIDDYHRAIHL
jgi:hypothetical protein